MSKETILRRKETLEILLKQSQSVEPVPVAEPMEPAEQATDPAAGVEYANKLFDQLAEQIGQETQRMIDSAVPEGS
jgi:hypothetical protein